MPRLLKLRVAALERTAHELRFAPAAAARRQTARAEKLAAMIDASALYPEDFVVYHITGFRPDMPEPELIPGDALLRDLAALIDRLSRRAAFTRDELAAPQWLTVEDLRERWGVSRKSVERLRAKGLIGRRVALPRGRAMNVFSAAIVRAVETRHGLAGGARARPRTAAKPAPSAQPQPAVTVRQRRLVERAMRAGIKPKALAQKLGKSKATVFRSRQRQLADRCRAVRVAIPAGAVGLIESEGLRFIADPAARSGLGAPGAATIAEHVADAIRAGWPDPLVERSRAFAYWTLVARAQTAARGLDRTRPSALAIDRVVTDLRWAALLKAELVRAEQLLLLRTIEVQLGTPLQELPPDRAGALLRRGLAALCSAVDRFDPTAGRLAGVAGMELNRAVARWHAEQAAAPARAQPLTPPRLDDWTRSVSPWQAWTNPPDSLAAALTARPAAERALLAAHYGLGGAAPRDVQELAAETGKPARIVARLLHTAERAAIKAAAPASPRRRGRPRKPSGGSAA
ncbi:MAG TPA: hypothetical protein VEB59_00320 [Gemmatimonadales bacterium]|nr:hypothetical protein [Gemmatimonadales bacterium]